MIKEGTTWAGNFPFEAKTSLIIEGLSKEKLEGYGFTGTKVDSIVDAPFWEFLLLNYSERHSEGHSITHVRSEGVCVYSMGSSPIQVSMQLAFRSDHNTDDFVSFMWLYTNFLRGSRLHKLYLEFIVQIEDTHFFLHPGGITVRDSSSIPDFKIVSLHGLGYKYAVDSYGEEPTSISEEAKADINAIVATTGTTNDNSKVGSVTAAWEEAYRKTGVPTTFDKVADNVSLFFPTASLNLLEVKPSAVIDNPQSSDFIKVLEKSTGSTATAFTVEKAVSSLKNQCASAFPYFDVESIAATATLPLFKGNGVVTRLTGKTNGKDTEQYVYVVPDSTSVGGVNISGTLRSAVDAGLFNE